MLAAALSQGLPSPIQVQVEGNKLDVAYGVAEEVRRRVAAIPGAVDVRFQQRLDAPSIQVDIDRTKAARLGLSADDVVRDLVTAIGSSISFDKSFWIDRNNGNHYFVGAQYPESEIKSFATLEDLPVGGGEGRKPVPLKARHRI